MNSSSHIKLPNQPLRTNRIMVAVWATLFLLSSPCAEGFSPMKSLFFPFFSGSGDLPFSHSRRITTTGTNSNMPSRWSSRTSLFSALRNDVVQNRGRNSRTQLNYQDGDEMESSKRRLEHYAAAAKVGAQPKRWWQSLVAPKVSSPPENKEQVDLDDYLEFVERRFNRLYVEEDVLAQKDPSSSIATAWNWVTEKLPSSSLEEHDPQDALHVFDLAGLASDELLRKHLSAGKEKSPPKETKSKPRSARSHYVATIDLSRVNQASTAGGLFAAGSSVLHRLESSGIVMFSFLQAKAAILKAKWAFHAATKAAWLKAAKITSSVALLGVDRKTTLTATTTVAASILVLVTMGHVASAAATARKAHNSS